MKKTEFKHRDTPHKKLGLHRETLRCLDPAELRRLQAGRQDAAVSSPCLPSITTNP
jgi:hypothetical protein